MVWWESWTSENPSLSQQLLNGWLGQTPLEGTRDKTKGRKELFSYWAQILRGSFKITWVQHNRNHTIRGVCTMKEVLERRQFNSRLGTGKSLQHSFFASCLKNIKYMDVYIFAWSVLPCWHDFVIFHPPKRRVLPKGGFPCRRAAESCLGKTEYKDK